MRAGDANVCRGLRRTVDFDWLTEAMTSHDRHGHVIYYEYFKKKKKKKTCLEGHVPAYRNICQCLQETRSEAWKDSGFRIQDSSFLAGLLLSSNRPVLSHSLLCECTGCAKLLIPSD